MYQVPNKSPNPKLANSGNLSDDKFDDDVDSVNSSIDKKKPVVEDRNSISHGNEFSAIDVSTFV